LIETTVSDPAGGEIKGKQLRRLESVTQQSCRAETDPVYWKTYNDDGGFA
jgi:hypothetical protein